MNFSSLDVHTEVEDPRQVGERAVDLDRAPEGALEILHLKGHRGQVLWSGRWARGEVGDSEDSREENRRREADSPQSSKQKYRLTDKGRDALEMLGGEN